MAHPNKLPLDVRIIVCADCGAYGINLDACRAQSHHLCTVHYEISDAQNDAVAIQRIAELKRHGRRLLGSESSSAAADE